MLPPHLVVEVVSPDERNRDRDYGRKRQQYAARGIPKYWLIDPEQNAITVLQLDQGSYVEVGQFSGSAQINSPKLAEMGVALTLTAERVLDAVK
jgi:Uma2 family endonuclease